MRKCIVDTDILSEISRGINQAILGNAKQYLASHSVLTITSVSVYEALYGLYAKPAPGQAEKFLHLIGSQDEIVPEKDDYRVAAQIRAALHRKGTEIGRADPVIAACAFRRQIDIVTGNTKHYQFITDVGFPLSIVNWRD